QQETKVKLVNDSQRKEKWRIGDKLEFRCKYYYGTWTAVGIKILQRASLFSSFSFCTIANTKTKMLLRRIGDIKATATVKNKQEKAFQILNWLERPLEDDLINCYKDLHDPSHQDENNSKLQWLKIQITLEAMKYVAKECITEVCSIPKELIERVNRNLNHCSGSPSMTDSDSTNISHAIVLLRGFIEKYHNIKEEEDLTNLQKELEQIEVLPILVEQQTSDDMHWIISKQATNQRRLRIYLYCPGCTELKTDRVRDVFFRNIRGADRRYPLKLVKEDIPWLYWSDFQVAPNFQLSCSIFDQEGEVTTATISASAQVIIVEEQSLRKSVAAFEHTMSSNENVEIFRHLIREVKDESSFCFAMTIVKDLKEQLILSEFDISDASTDITSKLDQLDATHEQ
ncbi:hypothetical protein RFI_36844, partial [Reticulomyxa filosa]